jgi:hypothetical protein
LNTFCQGAMSKRLNTVPRLVTELLLILVPNIVSLIGE